MKAPFDHHGNLMHYPQDQFDYDPATQRSTRIPPDWREVDEFESSLTLDGTCRGRSSAYFIWKDIAGHEYPMFLTDIADLVRRGVIEYGTVHDGTWTIRKRGQNYGIRMANGE